MNEEITSPEKNPNVLFERCEQPIDVKAGLKIPANSSVWLDFRGEKSPQSPLWLLQQWTRAELISLKKNLPYDSVVLFRGEEPLLKHLVLHSFFKNLPLLLLELIAEIALHPSFPSRFKTMWYHDLLVEKFFCSWKLQSSFINFFSSHSISTTSSGTNFSTCCTQFAFSSGIIASTTFSSHFPNV